ncbi:MAG: hypothetical protein EHM93_04730 [Bacteroidales bacterium]|nr:MAG: hypothetical protein EHM93_04730 [Bacteroidales bacterium]
MRALFLGVIFFLLCQKGYTQDSKEISSRVASGKIFSNEQEMKEWIRLCENDTAQLFFVLAYSKIDSISAEKFSNATYLLKNLIVKQSSQKVKKAAVLFFITAAKSKHSGVSSIAFKALSSIPSRFYENASIDSISNLIIEQPMLFKNAVLLAGYIGSPIFIERIKTVFPNAKNFSNPDKWAAYKALARLGDQEALGFCIKRVTSLPLSDQVVDVLYPDLIYIHRKEAFDVLVKALNSDEMLCSSSNPNSDNKILCGYRVMELLAPQIENFPVKVLPSGDLDSKDYKKTLNDVRAWFTNNGGNYSIINTY